MYKWKYVEVETKLVLDTVNFSITVTIIIYHFN